MRREEANLLVCPGVSNEVPAAVLPRFQRAEAAVNQDHSLEQLAHDHYDRLFRAAVFMCGREDAAEDLVQETFLGAARSLKSFEGRSSRYTWLYGIMLNKFRAWLRNKKGPISLQDLARHGDEEGDPADMLPDDDVGVLHRVASRETAEIVRAAIQRLPAHHRDVLVRRYLEKMSYEDIARALSCPLGTVKSRVHYALKRIALEIDEDGLV